MSSTEITKKTSGDIMHSALKAAVSAVPFAGGALAEIVQNLIKPPLEKRREAWFEALAERLNQLEQEGLDLTSLADDENFVSAVMKATQIAMSTHYEAKLDALRNALINIAVGQAPNEIIQHMFFNWIEYLSPTHLQVLKTFKQPVSPAGRTMGTLRDIFVSAFPNLLQARELQDQIWSDLHSRGLVNTRDLTVHLSNEGLAQSRTTDMGNLFISFITFPKHAG